MRARAEGGELGLAGVVHADEGRLVARLVDVIRRREDGDAEAVVLDAEALLANLVRAEDGGDCRETATGTGQRVRAHGEGMSPGGVASTHLRSPRTSAS